MQGFSSVPRQPDYFDLGYTGKEGGKGLQYELIIIDQQSGKALLWDYLGFGLFGLETEAPADRLKVHIIYRATSMPKYRNYQSYCIYYVFINWLL